AEGEEIEPSKITFQDVMHARDALRAAIRDADPDNADAAVTFLAPRVSIEAIRDDLADEITPCLGAAAHAPILFASLVEGEFFTRRLSMLLRATIRQLAAEGQVRLRWFDEVPLDKQGGDGVFEILAAPRHVTSSVLIAPMMLAVEAEGRAARLLSGS